MAKSAEQEIIPRPPHTAWTTVATLRPPELWFDQSMFVVALD
jgi:hypothetical protein